MGNIYNEIVRLETAKSDIETAIESCGVNVPDTESIDTYASYIRQIPSAVFSGLNVDPTGGTDHYIQSIEQENGLIKTTVGGLVSTSSSGLVPKADSAVDTINSQVNDWVLTNKNGTIDWYKLPDTTFKNDNTTYSLSGILSGDTFVTTLTPSNGDSTKATIPTMVGASSTSDGWAGLVPTPGKGNEGKFLKGDGTWGLPSETMSSSSLYVGTKDSASNDETLNGNTYLKLFENSTLKYQYNIKGTGNTTVVSDSSGNLIINTTTSWDNVTDKPETFNPTLHTHTSNQITALTDYVKANTIDALSTDDSLNTALGKLEYKADVTYNLVSAAYDGDGTIENLSEILKVLEGISDTDTIQAIVGKYLPLSGGTMTGRLIIDGSELNIRYTGDTPLKLQGVREDECTIKFQGTNSDGTSVNFGWLGIGPNGAFFENPNNVKNLIWHQGNLTKLSQLTDDVVSGKYLPLSGGTMIGAINLPSNHYRSSGLYAINLNNSDIIGVNGIYIADASQDPCEGINFARSNGNWDSLASYEGVLYYYPNRSNAIESWIGGYYTVIHSGNIGSQSVNYANSAGNSNYASSAGTALGITRIDDRGDNTSPYGDVIGQVTWHLKTNSSVGLPSTEYYSGVMILSPWGDPSGGAEHWLAFNSNGSIYHRYGTSSWSSWSTILNSANYTSFVYSKSDSDSRFVNVSGDTMTGPLTLMAQQYTGNYAINMSNSDIINLNAIYTKDLANEGNEGIQFKRTNGNYDSLWAADGVLYFSPNGNNPYHTGSYSTNYTVLHTGNYTSVLDSRYERSKTGVASPTSTAVGWYRCAQISSSNAGYTQNVIISLQRFYNSPQNEHYIFAISIGYNGQVNIS